MVKSWGLRAFVALLTFASSSSLCDDVSDYLDIPYPLVSDTLIELDIIRVDCPALEDDEELPEVIVSGGTLTLSADTTVRFVNIRFTVEDGGSLVFDMPKTQFGPNSGFVENAGGFLIDVKEGGSVTFTGKFGGREVDNVRSMFYNAGTMDFKGDALFQGNGNVFRSNSGTLKFRGDTIFRDNSYLPIDNIDAGYVRFSKTVIFDDNGGGFDGGDGCAIGNHDAEGTVIFRGDATFSDHSCDYAGAIFNAGKMRFYGKAYFNDNSSGVDGGAVVNRLGSLIFKAAAQFNRNRAYNYGGALSVEGGDVTFQKGVLFSENDVDDSGAAFSVTYGQHYEYGEVLDSGYGTLTFDKPDVVYFRDNTISRTFARPSVPACTIGYVEDDATLIGFPDDDVCVDKFA